RTIPDYVASRLLVEKRTLAFRRAPRLVRPVMTIPVVVHVIYNTPEQNVSDEQIRSQMVVVNKDFRARNSEIKSIPRPFKKLVGDARLAFKLAVRDPDGNPTSGITRTHTEVSIFDLDDSMKFRSTGGADAWPTDRYLNMWVCDLKERHGYAQFPAPPANTDGVVIDYESFGTIGTAKYPFHKGRTATHEIGHWLNLLHVWGDDGKGCERSDNVEDTPNQAGPNKGKPQYPHITCNNDPHGDMFMNYMDYSDDDIMCMFSKGQCERMFATLDGFRAALQYSDGLMKPTKKTMAARLAPPTTGRRASPQFVFNGVDWV
ncbi:MAG: zinc metalloprotease, partial [Nitrososphaera sp.]|nr:zinc metalloprotease [Nitrososphaera sp.]